jgi:adenylate cyclase
MTVVERLVEINDWPVCRKLILVDVLFLPAHLIAVAIARANFVSSGTVDVQLLDAAYGLGSIGFFASLWIGLRAARAGREGRWGAYLLVVMFGTYLVAAMQMLGTWTSSSIVLLPVAVMTAFVVFGNAIGGFAFVFSLTLLLATDALEAFGVLPYAPAVLDRSVDAQRVAQGVTGEGALALLAYFVAYASCWFTVETRRQRESQLKEARQQLERSNQLIAR